MEYSSAEALITDIKSDRVLPVYVLSGREPFAIDQVVSHVENNLLNDAEKAFNMSVLYGRDIDAKQIFDHARQFPMMAERRVVIIKEAQQLRDIKGLEPYIQNPSPQTVLVIAHKKKIDGRIKWVKSAKKQDNVGMLISEPISDYKMAGWVKKYVAAQKLKITPEATEMICQYLGTDLKKVTNEIEKVKLNLGESKTIDVAQIEKYIGVSRDYDIYALLKALSAGDISRVQVIAQNIESNEKKLPLQMIIPGMAAYFEKVLIVAQNFKKDDRTIGGMIGAYSSFVTEYRNMAKMYGYNGLIKVYSLLVQADAQSKGVDRRRPEGILKELIGKIILLRRQP